MKLPLLIISTVFGLLFTSCQPMNSGTQQVQPVITQQPPAPYASNRWPSHNSTRHSSSSSNPRKRNTITAMPEEKVEKPLPEIAPLSKPDPLKSLQTPSTPKIQSKPAFEVPENIKPKVSDGVDQGVFIELKW